MSATETRLKTWEILLPRDLSEYVETMLANKQFASADALFVSALHAYRDIAEVNRLRNERLNAELQVGIDQLERGEVVEGDAMFARLRKKLDDAEATRA